MKHQILSPLKIVVYRFICLCGRDCDEWPELIVVFDGASPEHIQSLDATQLKDPHHGRELIIDSKLDRAAAW